MVAESLVPVQRLEKEVGDAKHLFYDTASLETIQLNVVFLNTLIKSKLGLYKFLNWHMIYDSALFRHLYIVVNHLYIRVVYTANV